MVSRRHIPALDGLRFFAAFFVMVSHYIHWVLYDQHFDSPVLSNFTDLSGLGMSLFFVLSGFVIHYNYQYVFSDPSGSKRFFVARFSRLYPLFFVLFGIEFITSFYYHRGSCGHAGDRWGFFLALPYYLTFTQDWFYSVICKNNLLYQYHMVGDVSWSISVEAFFYICYLFIVSWLNAQKNIIKQLSAAAIGNLAVLGYFLLCDHFSARIEHVAFTAFGPFATEAHGYQDSLMRWLYYFNPLMNLAAFFTGAIAANIYISLKDKPLSAMEAKWQEWIAAASIALCVGSFYYFYDVLARNSGFISRTASSLIVPVVGIMIYALARYSQSRCSRAIGFSLLVKLGEASYSIYLLHAFLGWFPRDYYYLGFHPLMLYAISIVCVLIISRFSYVYFERPAQRWLRRKMDATS